jgi:nucleoside-diphosphate-sugar epimerase
VHVEDICGSVLAVLTADPGKVNGEVFNVGANSENYRVREIAQIVAEGFPGCTVSSGPPSKDNRSYRVSFDKIAKLVPAFRCKWTAADGVRELRSIFERIEMSPETFAFRAFTRLKQLRYLSATRQLDDDFFWKE